MNTITMFLAITEEQLITYFKDKKAISENSAINLDLDDLKKKLDTPEFLESNLISYGYIKKTKDNKYYLDDKALSKQTKQVAKVLMIIILIFVIFLFFTVFVPSIFTVLMWIFGW